MKTEISAQQLVYFRKNGHIQFSPFQSTIHNLNLEQEESDLWRKDPKLQRFILRTLGPIALELTGKSLLRLTVDRWIKQPPTAGRMQDLFCFQGMALMFLLKEETLDIYEPSSLCSHIPENCYLVVFGFENVRFVENQKDPHMTALKKMGYAYGDLLKTEFHPLVI